MKKIFLTGIIAVPLFTGMLLSSCGNHKPEEGEHSTTDTTKTDSLASNMGAESNEILYLVPAPGEMLKFIKDLTGKGTKNTAFLNPIDNEKKYAIVKAKALNFGIYSCDLSYCSIFEIGTDAIKYMKVVKKLGDDIGVSAIVRPDLIKRIESNIGNSDSLEYLSNDIYLSSFESLLEGEQGPTLALVICGGYIESLHIVCNLTKYTNNSPAIERIAEQKYTLDNIIEFMRKHEADPSVAEVVVQLTELKGLFDQLSEKPVSPPKPVKGKKILAGGSIIEITQEQYQSISEKVKSIRNSFAQIN